MNMGYSYDSDEGRAMCGALTAVMTGVAYATSAEMAKELGPFPGYERNSKHMLRVMRNHALAAEGATDGYDALDVKPVPLDHVNSPDVQLSELSKTVWQEAVKLGEQYGYRNAQVSVIAPTGTIGLVMDCDTTGIEPDFAIVKFKKLAGGGYFKIINRVVPEALSRLGYTKNQQQDITRYAVGHGNLESCQSVSINALKDKGFTDAILAKLAGSLENAFDIKFAFNRYGLGDDFCRDTLGFTDEQLNDFDFNMLEALGFSKEEI